MDTVTVHYWPTESLGRSSVQPLTFILTITVILSSCTTLILCTSVLTDHWETIEWDFQEVSIYFYPIKTLSDYYRPNIILGDINFKNTK